MIKGFEGIKIDNNRLNEVDKLQLRREIIAVNSNEEVKAKFISAIGSNSENKINSALAYVLGITNEIPKGECSILYYDATFPDIDFDVANRDVVINYVVSKYGEDRVARIGTTGTFLARNSTNDVAKQLRLPRFEFNNLVDSIENFTANDSRKEKALDVALHETAEGKRLLAKYPEFEIAGRLGGVPSNRSTHASGVIVSNEPISKTFAIDATQGSVLAEAEDLESLGFVKVDVLGLENLNTYSKVIEMANLPLNYLDTIPLDDEKTFDLINSGQLRGIFQLEGSTVRDIAGKVKVDCFNDIAVISAIARPGALDSGDAYRWCERRGGAKVEYDHEILKSYLEETLGIIAYQEQVMKIANELCDMDWETVGRLRKTIGKSKGRESMSEFESPFVNGLINSGMTKEGAERFWEKVLASSRYSFNKSHAIAYGMVSYWSAYLKAHYPLEFACAALTSSKSKDKQFAILKEMQDAGISYKPIDPDHSTNEWRVVTVDGKKELLGPLSSVKGLGPKKVQQILWARETGTPIPDAIQKILAKGKTEYDTITPITDRLIELSKHGKLHGITEIGTIEPNGTWQDINIAGLLTVIETRDENEEQRVKDRIARGQRGTYEGQTKFLRCFVADDSGEYYCKIGCKDYETYGKRILEGATAKKTLVWCKVSITPEIPIALVKDIRIIGEME